MHASYQALHYDGPMVPELNIWARTQAENVFVKHYAPNYMLAPKENIYHLSLWSLIGKSQKRDITQSIMWGIYSKFIQVI